MDVGRRLILFVQVGELPDLAQILLSHELIGILSRLLDLCKHFNALQVKCRGGSLATLRRHQKGQLAAIDIASLLAAERRTNLVLKRDLLHLGCLLLRDFNLPTERLAQLIEAIGDDHLEVIELPVEHMVRRRLVHLLLDHLNIAIDYAFPLFGIEAGCLFRAITEG